MDHPKFINPNFNRDFNNQGPFWVNTEELPISCPRNDMPLWNAHPKVYLPIEETGQAICPYCSARYILKNSETHTEDTA